ncbi:hypothetical protein BKA69DRAFT_785695 [Paraphysoderma sedebokerense]|nr:hypothetical protein BKA69DRAFT_785695 [Paraphysoderma sedebokerense]
MTSAADNTNANRLKQNCAFLDSIAGNHDLFSSSIQLFPAEILQEAANSIDDSSAITSSNMRKHIKYLHKKIESLETEVDSKLSDSSSADAIVSADPASLSHMAEFNKVTGNITKEMNRFIKQYPVEIEPWIRHFRMNGRQTKKPKNDDLGKLSSEALPSLKAVKKFLETIETQKAMDEAIHKTLDPALTENLGRIKDGLDISVVGLVDELEKERKMLSR